MSYPWLSLLVCIPFYGVLFVMLSKNENEREKNFNLLNVGALNIIADLFVIFKIFNFMNIDSKALQLAEVYTWVENPMLKISLAVDVFSLMIIFAVHIAFLIGFWGVSHKQKDMKYMVAFALLTLSMMNGFFVAADMFSFYIFFQAMLLPIFLLIGMFGGIKKENVIFRFFTYNLLASMLLFIATMLIYSLENENISLKNIQNLQFKGWLAFVVWGGILVSFLSRIPIWPFHYFISSISSNIKNPLVFIVVEIMPLSGLYGFVRFWPNAIPFADIKYTYILEIVSLITMVFIALIGLANKEIHYKLFSYMTVYYLIYLQGVLLPTNMLMMNIAYSVFSYLIITSSIASLNAFIERQTDYDDVGGVLCRMPKVMFLFSIMTLAAVGLPISSLFANNFIIIAEIFNHNLYIGIFCTLSLFFAAASLLSDFYHMKDESCSLKSNVNDISLFRFAGMMVFIILLIMAFIKPLWFVL